MKTIVALSLLLTVVAHSADTNPETACRTHLRNLGGAVKAYALIHDNKSPTKLSELYLEGLLDSLGDFTCPASGTSITAASEIDAKSDYALGTGDVLIREKTSRHDGKALAVFADGAIKPVDGAVAKSAPSTPVPETRPSQPPSSEAAPTTKSAPAGPVSVTREGVTPSAPPLGPRPVTREAAPPVVTRKTPASKEEPAFEVTKADAGMSFEGAADFGDMMGITFAIQADGKIIIGSVKADSVGEEIGFKRGDVVVEINEKPAPKGTGAARSVTLAELAKMAGAPEGQSLLITVLKADNDKVSFSMMTSLPALNGK